MMIIYFYKVLSHLREEGLSYIKRFETRYNKEKKEIKYPVY